MATRSGSFVARPAGAETTVAAQPSKRSYFSSSVGTKVLIGTTGLLLVVYLILHLAGNLLILFGPATFNGYSYFLLANPLIVPVEIGLAAVFVLHVYKAVTNWGRNRGARPVNYYQSGRRLFGRGWAGPPSRKTIASSTMIFSGFVLFVFLLIHLRQFKFGAEYFITDPATGEPMRDLYRLEFEQFANAITVGFYVLCMVVVGGHLWHGFSSAFNSLGADHPKYTPWIMLFGRVLAVVLAGGFIFLPIWVYVTGGVR